MPLDAELTAAEWMSDGVVGVLDEWWLDDEDEDEEADEGVEGTTGVEFVLDVELLLRLLALLLDVEPDDEFNDWTEMLRSSLANAVTQGCCITCSNDKRSLGFLIGIYFDYFVS